MTHQLQKDAASPVAPDIFGLVRIFKSKEWTPKPKPRHDSLKIYAEFLSSYHVHLACDFCLQLSQDGLATIGANEHDCSGDRLVLFDKSMDGRLNGKQIRKRSSRFSGRKGFGICEHVQNQEECPDRQRCPCPHNDLELELWKRDEKKEISISGFISDLGHSSLKTQHFVELVCQEHRGSFELLCRICFSSNRTYEGSTKKKHTPFCNNGHNWKQNRCLVFVKEAKVIEVEKNAADASSDEEKNIINCVSCFLVSDEDKEEIVDLSNRFKQKEVYVRARSLPESDAPFLDDFDAKASEVDVFFAKEEEQIYDSDFENMLDLTAFDDDIGDSRDENVSKDETGTKNFNYYAMKSEDEVLKLLFDEPDKYVRGIIQLQGPFDATFVALDDKMRSQEIKILGRKNCGPAFSGDEVVIEKIEAQDSDTGEKVVRGLVIRVMKRNSNRTARTFVCSVDDNSSNLMRPLCGTVPKIHIIDSYVKEKYPNGLKNYLAIYDKDLKMRKVLHLDAKRRKEMLFVVKYLKWDTIHVYPLGYAWKVVKCGTDEDSSQHIINIIHEVHANDTTAQYDNKAESNTTSLTDGEDKREDYKQLTTISIDPPNCHDIDDALSLEIVDGNIYRVGVHIADVGYFVKKDDDIDCEARRRAFSSYSSSNRTYHMLPRALAENGLSLIENQERKVLSVIFSMNVEAQKVIDSKVVNAEIVCNRNMTYQEAQNIIVNGNDENLNIDVVNTVIQLNMLAHELRSRRMGEGKYFFDHDPVCNEYRTTDLFLNDQCHDAKRLVEEFMILANLEIATFLIASFPSTVPLRKQDPPDNDHRLLWQSKHGQILPRSFFFQQFNSLDVLRNDQAGYCVLLWQICEELEKAIEDEDAMRLERIIGSEGLHPLHSIAMSEWYLIQKPAKFVLSSSNNVDHFSLGMLQYVQFTSPIRRYMDLVVHRFVKAAIANQQRVILSDPYSSDEMSQLCDRMSFRSGLNQNFNNASALLRVATMLSTPCYMSCFVDLLDKFGIRLSAPYFSSGKLKQMKVKFSELAVNGTPNVPVEHNFQLKTAVLRWKQRLYDTRGSNTPNARAQVMEDELQVLDEVMHGKKVDGRHWNRVQNLIVRGDVRLITSAMIWPDNRNVNLVGENYEADDDSDDDDDREHGIAEPSSVRDVTSEMNEHQPLLNHFVNFSQKLSQGSIVSALFGSDTWSGSLVPSVKMINLTSSIDLCIEHSREPVKCFAAVATKRSLPNYRNMSDYQEIWLAILAMEAATNATRSGDSMSCCQVPVCLRLRNGSYFGTIKLKKQFCTERKMRLFSESDQGEETSDYLCIRYQSSSERNWSPNIWVCHGVVLKGELTGLDLQAEEVSNIEVCIQFRISFLSTEPPAELLRMERNLCTIEFLPRDLSDK